MPADIHAKFGKDSSGAVVKGESKDANHVDEVDVLSVSFKSTNLRVGSPAARAGNADIKSKIDNVAITKLTDSASPNLFLASVNGAKFAEVVITFSKVGPNNKPLDFLAYTLTEVTIASFHVGTVSGDNSHPVETVELNFRQMQMDYVVQKDDGEAGRQYSTSWNLSTNKPGG